MFSSVFQAFSTVEELTSARRKEEPAAEVDPVAAAAESAEKQKAELLATAEGSEDQSQLYDSVSCFLSSFLVYVCALCVFVCVRCVVFVCVCVVFVFVCVSLSFFLSLFV